MNSSSERPGRRPVRWWPAIVILVLMLGMLVRIWLGDTGSTQHKVIPTFPTLFFGAVLLFLWAILFSRLPGRTRLGILLVVGVVVGVGFLTLEIQGVDGNLVPIVGLKGGDARSFEDTGTSVAGVTAPGPNDYPQLYGAGRSATLSSPRLARDWDAQPPRELWRREVGEGWSSFAVVGNAAVTQEQRGDSQTVVRYDLRTGQQAWVHTDGDAFNTTVGGRGPRATPTIAEGRVYSLNATGVLSCLDLDTGAAVWSAEVLQDNEAGQPDWGTVSSPLVVGDVVVVQLGKNGKGLAAYDRSNGEPVWVEGEARGTYSSPLLATILGREMILILNHTNVQGHHPGTGEILMTADWPNPAGGERITMPLVMSENRLLVSAGYGVGSKLFQLVSERGAVVAEAVWESLRLKSKFAPMVQRDGVVYGLDDGVLVALDPATGERLWKRGRYGHGQMILVDDLLLIQAENGDVVLVEANPREQRELTRFAALDSKTWNPPALSGARLLVRNNKEAVCYELPVDR